MDRLHAEDLFHFTRTHMCLLTEKIVNGLSYTSSFLFSFIQALSFFLPILQQFRVEEGDGSAT
jgi:hypothetical protein